MRIKLWAILVGLFVTVWFCGSGRASEEKVYLSKPELVPEWAEQGNFRFLRLDGGMIETRKAQRTWWGQNFPAQENDVLANIYGRDFDKMLGLLKDADFNWIWVTWSNGWSLESEQKNREDLEKVIANCHANGIQVSAYLSASNMFWWDVFRKEPQSRGWLLKSFGLPILYGASPHRLLADVSKPEWRAYLLKKAELAIDAGADAVWYDNIFGDNYANKLLMSETQALAEKKAKASGRPKALVGGNVHLSPGRFDINDSCDLLWDESGKDTPGVWEDGWEVSNARKIKFILGEKQAWQPLMFENDVYHCGPRERCIPSPIEQKLGIAEAYAFGAALSRNIEGRFLKGLITDEKPALDAWAAIGQYNRFVDENKDLYNGVTQVARIALLSEGEKNPLADEFLKRNVMFGSKVLKHLGKGEPLGSYRVLVIPFPLKNFLPEQEKTLSDFTANNGKIFAVDPPEFSGDAGAVTRISGAAALRIAAGEPVEKLISQIQAAAGGPVLSLVDSGHVAANVTRKNDGSAFIAHFINYDHKHPVIGMKVKLNLAGFADDLAGFKMKLISPDENHPVAQNVSIKGSGIEFSITEIQHYAVAVISK